MEIKSFSLCLTILLLKIKILLAFGGFYQKLDVDSSKVLFEEEFLITARKLSKISCLKSCNFRNDCMSVVFNPRTLVCKTYTISQYFDDDSGETDIQVFKRIGEKRPISGSAR